MPTMTVNIAAGSPATIDTFIGLLDWFTNDAVLSDGTSTSFHLSGSFDGHDTAVTVTGTGLTYETDGDTYLTGGTITGLTWLTDGALTGGGVTNFSVADYLVAANADYSGTDPLAIENFYMGFNIVYNGGDGADNLPAGSLVGDGAPFNLRGNDILNMGGGNDVIFSGDGNDVIDGGIGADTMQGGIGNDTYWVDNAGDHVIEANGQGTDTVNSYVSFNLSGQEIENLNLRGFASIDGTGNSIANIIVGNSGNNVIDGLGGADTMKGGAGNDTYWVDNAGDHVIEANGQGTDTVNSYVSFNLSGQEIENLNLRGFASIDGTGNSIANIIVGNSGNNVIDGLGGADTMKGAQGNDTYWVDNAGDHVIEANGQGTDTVNSTVSFNMGGSELENLNLRGPASINGTGNSIANVIVGNSGNNVIDGLGGADTLDGGGGNDLIYATNGSDNAFGGTGDDTFVVSGTSGDVVTINDDAGHDTLDFSAGTTAASIDLHASASSHVDGREIIINGGDVTRPLDLVLLEDLSGSFSDDVYTLRSLAPDLISGLQAIQPDIRFGVSSFVDKPISPFGSYGDYVYETNLALTADASAFETTIDNLSTYSGNDFPEAQLEALLQVAVRGNSAEIGFRSGAMRAVVIATDDRPHIAGDFSSAPPNNGDAVLDGGGTGEDYPSVDQVKAALLAAGVVPIFAVADSFVGDYQAIVDQIGFGSVVSLSSDSSDIIDSITSGLVSINTANIEDAIGTQYADTIIGNELNNVIDGLGGADTMQGGTGDDTYWVDNAGDHVIEANGEGTDTVNSTVSFNMGGSEIENLNLRGFASINGTGNSIANVINGNSGVNILIGLGGNDTLDGKEGADTMQGGIGNDTYWVDNAGDHAIEANGQGTDTVNSYVSFNMGGSELEILNLRGFASINGTGNSIANIIVGNSGNNVIDGLGGADTMKGAEGNDTYWVDNAGDHVIEANGQGTDTVNSTVSFNMGGSELENLNLRGPASINGTGNSIANVIVGNSGANVLNGLGGHNTLTGAQGNDTFVFNAPASAANSDVITDFAHVAGNTDTIELENAVYTHLAAGDLNAANLAIGHAALDANDYLVYNPDTGNLAYDADGSGAGGTVLIANLANHVALTAADFFVI